MATVNLIRDVFSSGAGEDMHRRVDGEHTALRLLPLLL